MARNSLIVTLATAVLFLVLSFAAHAQDTVTSLDQVDSTDVLAQLSDSELRKLLSDRLGASEPAGSTNFGFNPAITLWRLQKDFGIVRARFTELLEVRHKAKEELRDAWLKVTGPRQSGSFLRFFLALLAAFVMGFVVEKMSARLLNPIKDAISGRSQGSQDQTTLDRVRGLGGFFVTRLAAIVIFSLTALFVFFVLNSTGGQDRTTFFFYLGAVIIARLASSFVALFYAPTHSHLRLPLFSDRQAKGMHRGLVITVLLTAFAFFTCALIGTLGVRSDAHPLLLMTVGNIFVVTLGITVLSYRRAISHDLSAFTLERSPRHLLAQVWPWLVMIVVTAIWVSVIFTALKGGSPLYGAALVTVMILLFYPTVDAALEREAVDAEKADHEITVAIMRVVRLVGFVVIVAVIASIWRVRLLALDGGGIGSQITASALQIGLTLLVSYVLWQAARIWIDRKIAEEDGALAELGVDPAEMEIGGEGASRTRTLLPLLKLTLRMTLGTIVLMIVLAALGVNIAPVLAGAGVVGLAIGFGSQTLVRDIVSGAFFLLDDAFRLGEYVDVGEVKGTVEKIRIRSLVLRHHRGAVHTVPFGEISTLTNYSRDWAIMKLRFRLAFDVNVEKVRKVLKKVGQELLEHPDVGEDFLQPFKSQGVLEVDDYGLIVRAKFMCKPGRQFLIRRYAYVAIQDAFKENGIEFARPEVRVISEGEDDLEEEDAKAVAASIATRPAIQDPAATPQPT